MSNILKVVISTDEDEPNEHIMNIFNGKSTSGKTITESIIFINNKLLDPTLDEYYSLIKRAFETSNPNDYVVVIRDDIISERSAEELINILENLIESQKYSARNVFD